MRKVQIVCSVSLGVAQILCASEAKVSFQDLPAAVQASAKRQSKGATVRGYAKEIEHGQTYYEVETKISGRNKDILLDEKGAVVEIEQEMDRKDVPEAVMTGLKKAAAGGSLQSIESVTRGQKVSYEAVVQTAGRKHEVAVDQSGNRIKTD